MFFLPALKSRAVMSLVRLNLLLALILTVGDINECAKSLMSAPPKCSEAGDLSFKSASTSVLLDLLTEIRISLLASILLREFPRFYSLIFGESDSSDTASIRFGDSSSLFPSPTFLSGVNTREPLKYFLLFGLNVAFLTFSMRPLCSISSCSIRSKSRPYSAITALRSSPCFRRTSLSCLILSKEVTV